MDEVNVCIAANAEQEEPVDQPEVQRGVVRVSEPFTVKAVQPAEMSLGEVIDYTRPPTFEGAPEEVGQVFAIQPVEVGDSRANVEAYLERMVRLLRGDGLRFTDNKQ